MIELSPETEQWFADASEAELDAFLAKIRKPDQREEFREIVKPYVPEHFLDEFVRVAKISNFVDDDGNLDGDSVRRHLEVLSNAFTKTPNEGQST